MNKALDIQPIVQNDHLNAWSLDGQEDTVVIAISGIGYDHEDVPNYEFARCASKDGLRPTLFLSDPNRSWLSHPNLIEDMAGIISDFVTRAKAKTVVALGHSLGGFSALILPAFTKIDRVISFAPQMSVDPKIVPDEMRWENYRSKITDHRIGLASDHFVPQTHYSIVHGLHSRDKLHRELVPQTTNIRHYLLPKIGHDVARRLKASGALDPFVNAVCEGRDHRAKMILKKHFKANVIAKKETQVSTLSPALEGS